MARMIPPVIDPHTPSPGERYLFERFSRDAGTEDWVVLHSLDVASHVRQVVGEIDFVVVIPGKGVLCLEVKACRRLRRQGGAWFYGHEPTPDYRGPFKQASEGMHSLRRRVLDEGIDLRDVVFWWAVVFPFLDGIDRLDTDEWLSWEVICRSDTRGATVAPAFEQVLSRARQHLIATPSTAGSFNLGSRAPGPSTCEAIVSALRPDFELAETPESIRSRRAEELRHYTEEQFDALDLWQANERVLYEGPAGTGKTVLAIESVRRSALQGSRVLFVCYNALLGDSLSLQVRSFSRGITTRTLHGFMLDIVGRQHLERRDEPGFWTDLLPDLALEALLSGATGRQYDALVIDEAQDVVAAPYLDVLDLCLVGGLASGRWAAFGDFEKQAIYGDGSGRNNLLERGSSVARFPLRVNCRNVPRIAQLAVLLGELNPGYKRVLRPDWGDSPKLAYFTSREQQTQLLSNTLQGFLDEGFAPAEIVVLSNRRAAASSAAGLARTHPHLHLRELSRDTDPDAIRYGSVHVFKGLEAPAVILTDFDHIDNQSGDLFYVGITRATDRLHVLVHAAARQGILDLLTKADAHVA